MSLREFLIFQLWYFTKLYCKFKKVFKVALYANIFVFFNAIRGDCPIFNIPHPLSIYVRNSSTHLTLDVQFRTNPLPIQIIATQLKENMI